MAAILGFLDDLPGESAPPSIAWNTAVSRMSSRSGPGQEMVARDGLSWCYRGPNLQGCFQDSSHIVLVDGFVDNEERLEQELGDHEGSRGATGALLARLVQSRGLEALDRLTGDFAVVTVDRVRRHVYLMRDRFGARPLFYACTPSGWCWGSEIKFLLPLLQKTELDTEALAEVLHFRWLAGERTLVHGIRQVLPAHGVELAVGSEPHRRRYFHLRFRPTPGPVDHEMWLGRLDRALDAHFGRIAARHKRVGILLSGGVDSSLLAAKAMQAGFQKCVGLTGRMSGFDNPELPNAERVAAHLGMEHIVVDVEDSFVQEFFPHLVWRLESPPRHYNGFVVQKLFARAAPEVDAVIAGEGSDSLFGPRKLHWLANYMRKQKLLGYLPWSLRRALGVLLSEGSDTRRHRLGTLLRRSMEEIFPEIHSVDNVTRPPEIIPGIPAYAALNEDTSSTFDFPEDDWNERYQSVTIYTDCKSRLDLLDRLSAPLGLAVLNPFFAPEVIGIAAELPEALKIRPSSAKPLVCDIACRYFPPEWIYAPKLGFPTPLAHWLAQPLICWTRMLAQDRTARRGLYRMEKILGLNYDKDREMLWTVLCLEAFLREFIDGEGEFPAI